MGTTDVNLEEIQKLPDSELQKHFMQWVEEDGVARALQAKLRRDLIENFNRTGLGRRMFSQFTKSQGMILSPLILALNTLVAEFLYAQNCHYSLSVFSTEVPYRNTLPDFEIAEHFRFSKAELIEVFEAIAIDISEEFKDAVMQAYLKKSTTKDNRSLIFIIFKHLTKYINVKSEIEAEIKKPEVVKNNIKSDDSPSRTKQPSSYSNHFRYLNKYLIILSKKVKEMSNSIERLEKRDPISKDPHRKSTDARRMEKLNRSLDRVSDNLRNISKRKNQKFSVMLSSVEKMAQYLEKCAQSFESVSKNTSVKRGTAPNGTNESIDEKPYTEWVKNLKNTKNGKKFISRIETSIRRMLEKEKKKLSDEYDQKLEIQKNLLRIKYKQKLLEQTENKNVMETDIKHDDTTEEIHKKLEMLELKHNEMLKKLSECDKQILRVPLRNVEMGTQTSEETFCKKQEERQNKATLGDNSEQKIPEKPHKLQNSQTVKEFEPYLEKMAETIHQQERNIENIILDARLRVQELEQESKQLDQSFQDYLKKQRLNKSQSDEDANLIWRHYNREKLLLNTKYPKTYTRLLDKYDNKTKPVPETNIEHTKTLEQNKNLSQSKLELIKFSPPAFENPFRKLQKEILEKQLWKTRTNTQTSDEKNNITHSTEYNLGKEPQTPKCEAVQTCESGFSKHFRDEAVQTSNYKKIHFNIVPGPSYANKFSEMAPENIQEPTNATTTNQDKVVSFNNVILLQEKLKESLTKTKSWQTKRILQKNPKNITIDKTDSELEASSEDELENVESDISMISNEVPLHLSTIDTSIPNISETMKSKEDNATGVEVDVVDEAQINALYLLDKNFQDIVEHENLSNGNDVDIKIPVVATDNDVSPAD